METEPQNQEPTETTEPVRGEAADHKNIWHTVTPFSKYAAMILFIAMPFIGGWVGYHMAPEKVVEVERVVVDEVSVDTSNLTLDETELTMRIESYVFLYTDEVQPEFGSYGVLDNIRLPIPQGYKWFGVHDSYLLRSDESNVGQFHNLRIKFPYQAVPDCDWEANGDVIHCLPDQDGITPHVPIFTDEDFFEALVVEYDRNRSFTKLPFENSEISTLLYESDSEYRAVVNTTPRAFIVLFDKNVYNESHVRDYLGMITKR